MDNCSRLLRKILSNQDIILSRLAPGPGELSRREVLHLCAEASCVGIPYEATRFSNRDSPYNVSKEQYDVVSRNYNDYLFPEEYGE